MRCEDQSRNYAETNQLILEQISLQKISDQIIFQEAQEDSVKALLYWILIQVEMASRTSWNLL
jgi:hypothetical protein